MFFLPNAEIRLKYKAKKKTQQVITFVVVATPIPSFSHRRDLSIHRHKGRQNRKVFRE